MSYSNTSVIERANEEAIFNLYLYLAHKAIPEENETLKSATEKLEKVLNLSSHDTKRLNILKKAVALNPRLANSRISGLILSSEGLTACTFTKPDGSCSVVFKGTGSGEWIDNGEGLSGISEENTYIYYNNNGDEAYRRTVKDDYATDQQVEALNLFRKIAAEKGWNSDTDITVSGHSKGGNKAQFITISSELVDECFSFNGQGFSPEALTAFQRKYGPEYDKRRKKVKSFVSGNDFVNVLGKKLMPSQNIYYFEAYKGLHDIEFILDNNGNFNPPCKQGRLSAYVESVSEQLMNTSPYIRQYATLGVMNIFQKHIGSGTPVNGDSVSLEKTITGLAVTIGTILKRR